MATSELWLSVDIPHHTKNVEHPHRALHATAVVLSYENGLREKSLLDPSSAVSAETKRRELAEIPRLKVRGLSPLHIIDSLGVFSNFKVGCSHLFPFLLEHLVQSHRVILGIDTSTAIMSVPYVIEPMKGETGPKASDRIPIIARPFVSDRAKKTLDIV